MDEHLKEIITQQQEYEYIRNVSPLYLRRGFFRSRMMNCCVIPQIKAAQKKLRHTKLMKTAPKIIAVFLLCLPLYAMAALAPVSTTISHTETNALRNLSPIENMREALAANDFQKAEQILDDAAAKYPDSYYIKAAYAEIDMAKGNFDSAVITLNDIIMNRFGVQNVASAEYNTFYKNLKSISPDSLTTTREIYQNCISECEKYLAMHEAVNKYLEQENYASALQLLNELKAAGAYDGWLYYKYVQCYNGLGLYDECAQYLLSLYGKSTGITDDRYPDNRAIISYLDKIKDKASPNLRAEIAAKLPP